MDYLALSNTEAKASSLATVVKDIINGKKFTTGTVTFASNQLDPIIIHNLGVVPSQFLMIAKNVQGEFTFNAENQPPAGIYGYSRILSTNPANYFTGKNISVSTTNTNGSTLEWRANNSTTLNWYANTLNRGEPTETQIQLSYRNGAFQYLPNLEYEWIAIE